MESIWPYLGDLYNTTLPCHWVAVVLVLVSAFCGMVIGLEREAKNKPAGLKTLTLICVGSTVFTIISLLVAIYQRGDPGRIAAQIIPGIGFLGAGAILRERGTVIGLTTGATIWTVAAVGMLIGAGYAAAGIFLTLVILGMLTGVRLVEKKVLRACRYSTARIVFRPEKGKSFLHVLRILDEYALPDRAWTTSTKGDVEIMEVRYCHFHREHRAFLLEISELPEVIEIETDRAAPRKDENQNHLHEA